MGIESARHGHEARRGTSDDTVADSERPQRQQFPVYHGCQNGSWRIRPPGNELRESIQALSHTTVGTGPTQQFLILHEVGRSQQMQSRERLEGCSPPRGLKERERVTVERLPDAKGTRQNRIAWLPWSGKFSAAPVERSRGAGTPDRGLGRRGRPPAPVGPVPVNCAECLTRTIRGLADSGKVDEGLQWIAHSSERYPAPHCVG